MGPVDVRRLAALDMHGLAGTSSPATGTFDQFAARYGAAPGWRFHELKTGHDAMMLVPDEVTAILLQESGRT